MRALSFAPLFAAVQLAAQQLPLTVTLDSSTMVRLRLVQGDVVTGVLLAPVAPESAAVVFTAPPWRDCGVPRAACRFRVPTAEIRGIDVRRGSQAGRGAVVGGVVGAGLGLALGVAVAGMEPPSCLGVGPCGSGGASDLAIVSFSTFVVGVLGAGLGALLGLGSPSWGPAP